MDFGLTWSFERMISFFLFLTVQVSCKLELDKVTKRGFLSVFKWYLSEVK